MIYQKKNIRAKNFKSNIKTIDFICGLLYSFLILLKVNLISKNFRRGNKHKDQRNN
jgi:hypothetical protein